MKLNVRFFSSLYFSLLCASVSSNLLAAQTEDPERWFEIEVILFKQLDDKNLLKEQFPDNIDSSSLPDYAEYFDILTPYLQPNLSGIKQFMPLCSNIGVDEQSAFLESLAQLNVPFSNALKAFTHLNTFIMPDFIVSSTATVQKKHINTHDDIAQIDTDLSETKVENSISQSADEDINEKTNTIPETSLKLLASNLQKELENPLYSSQNICVISYKDFEQILSEEQLTTFKLDGFDVQTLPKKLHATGLHNPNGPYLIANESLLLADINQRLQWSKEFKPLLHFGWRQVGVTQDKAIPLKLFAGKYLNSEYQKSLTNYQSMLNKVKQAELLTIDKSESEQWPENIDIATNKTLLQKNNGAEIKQQKLSQVFNDLKNSSRSDNVTGLINSLAQQTLEDVITSEADSRLDSEQPNLNKPPVMPLQEWFLDGFFKVHLDHYLYITADFNVLSESFKTSTTQTAKNLSHVISSTNKKLIHFSQNKRAITGEIHYFDHPYVGMLVQIRRFDPSKPKEEAVSQVIK
jgi:hypothetical protein